MSLVVAHKCAFVHLLTYLVEENTGIELVRQMYKLIFETWIIYDQLSEIGIMT